MSVEVVNGKWHGVGKQRKELDIDGWEVIIFYGNAIAYREFHCKVYSEDEIRKAINDYIKKRRREEP